jgi:hypothetical protein
MPVTVNVSEMVEPVPAFPPVSPSSVTVHPKVEPTGEEVKSIEKAVSEQIV